MRYLMLIYVDEDKMQAMRDQIGQDAYTAKWMAYRGDLSKAGSLLGGEALMPASTATTMRGKDGGGTIATDGPFVETKEALGGYFVVEAANLDDAMAWAGKMPVFQTGGSVEIRPIVDFN